MTQQERLLAIELLRKGYDLLYISILFCTPRESLIKELSK
jgi:hypothetical protein